MKTIGFYGNSCTGKTSGMYAIASLLAAKGIAFRIQNMPYDNSGHVKNLKPFAADLLEETVEARIHFIMDHIASQTALAASGFKGFLLSEMTVTDLHYMYLWVCKLKFQTPSASICNLVYEWMQTYDTIFAMSDLGEYIQDGSRMASRDLKDGLSVFYTTIPFLSSVVKITTEDRELRTQEVVDVFKKTYLPSA